MHIKGEKRWLVPLLIILFGCGQQQSQEAETAFSSVHSEAVVASTPITSPVTPAEPVTEPAEWAQEKKLLFSVPVDPAARNKEVQLALRNANLYTGEIDGKIGPLSKKAVRQFQQSKGLTVDGVVGAKTWAGLKAYLPQEQSSRNE